MKKFFLSLAVFVMALCANAQTNQYFWYQGNLMMGNPIAQIDSVTFGEGEPADTLHIMLPRTIIKTVHDTLYITIHDTVCPNDIPEGALNGLFSVSADKKVRFSRGNVQYDATNHNWRFAEHQFDYTANASYFDPVGASGWLDLFGWGTGENPQNNSNDPSSYSSFVDWGVNFSDEAQGIGWRTLSAEEWDYLLGSRENHESLLARASINGINGLILFPDDYSNINNIQIQVGETSSFTTNILNEQEWNLIQAQGAVFLCAAGWVDNDLYQAYGVYDFNKNITYWTSTPSENHLAYAFGCSDNSIHIITNSGNQRSDKHSVRLVIDVR